MLVCLFSASSWRINESKYYDIERARDGRNLVVVGVAVVGGRRCGWNEKRTRKMEGERKGNCVGASFPCRKSLNSVKSLYSIFLLSSLRTPKNSRSDPEAAEMNRSLKSIPEIEQSGVCCYRRLTTRQCASRNSFRQNGHH